MTNNQTIDGVSRELLRKQFEEENAHRGWFVAGGTSESDTPEGFVYGDFTTDMCWTCYFTVSAALQSTIAQLQARIAELESGRGEPVAWLVESPADLEPINGVAYTKEQAEMYKAGRWAVRPVYTAPPAPVAVVLPELGSPPPLEHLRDLLKLVVDPGTYPLVVLHNQIRATLDGLDATAGLNEGRK